MRNSLKSLAYSFELWYNSLKIIEGHFGSGISTYFKFFRWLFIMNCLITLFVVGFIVVPQLLYIYIRPATSSSQSELLIYDNTNQSSNTTSVIVPEAVFKWHSFKNNESFAFRDIFTGEVILKYVQYYVNIKKKFFVYRVTLQIPFYIMVFTQKMLLI